MRKSYSLGRGWTTFHQGDEMKKRLFLLMCVVCAQYTVLLAAEAPQAQIDMQVRFAKEHHQTQEVSEQGTDFFDPHDDHPHRALVFMHSSPVPKEERHLVSAGIEQ